MWFCPLGHGEQESSLMGMELWRGASGSTERVALATGAIAEIWARGSLETAHISIKAQKLSLVCDLLKDLPFDLPEVLRPAQFPLLFSPLGRESQRRQLRLLPAPPPLINQWLPLPPPFYLHCGSQRV